MQPSEFSEVVGSLARMSVPQLQRLATEAATRARAAEARAEIERRCGERPACPHCKHVHVIRWGTSTGLQRWRLRISANSPRRFG